MYVHMYYFKHSSFKENQDDNISWYYCFRKKSISAYEKNIRITINIQNFFQENPIYSSGVNTKFFSLTTDNAFL